MKTLNMVLASALVASGLLILDTLPMTTADAAVASNAQTINRDGKAGRLATANDEIKQRDVTVRIETDAERGMTKVIRHVPQQTKSSGRTDFAFLAQ
jgi:hypothetical protein